MRTHLNGVALFQQRDDFGSIPSRSEFLIGLEEGENVTILPAVTLPNFKV